MIRDARWPKPVHLLIALAALALGLVLILAGLTVQQIAQITGIGIAIVGVMFVLRGLGKGIDREDRESDEAGTAAPRGLHLVSLIAGAALIIVGALMALWPDAGAPWLAVAVALTLIVQGVVSALSAIRGGTDRRVSGVLIALAGVALGVLAFSWPVLTLVIFRLAVGAWLVFQGLRVLFELWRGRAPRAAGTEKERSPRRSKIAHWSATIASAVALVLSVGAVYGSAQLLGGTPLPVPDKFYTAPDDVPSEAGQLLRTEPLTVGVPAGAQAWKMLYTTTNPDGSPAVSSGTILAPEQRDGSTLPLLSVSHGTTGVVDGCAPSIGATPFADGAGTAMAEIVTEHGWVAVTSDYVGMGTEGTAAYLVGDAEARNVLDASRAARQFSELSLSSDTVVWGHSQGGQGSLWTGQIASEYAPDLNVLGIAAFAPAADLYGLADADKNSAPGKTVSAYIAATWNEVFPELKLASELTPGSSGPVNRIAALCFNGSDALSAILLGSQVPNQVFPDSVLAGPFGDLLKQQSPTGPFPAPVLVAQGLSDPLVLPSMQEAWVDAHCKAGEAIDYRTFEGRDHVSLVAADSPLTPQIVEWTLDRWNGESAPTECTAKEYPKNDAG